MDQAVVIYDIFEGICFHII